jgi:hypothetical protein
MAGLLGVTWRATHLTHADFFRHAAILSLGPSRVIAFERRIGRITVVERFCITAIAIGRIDPRAEPMATSFILENPL